MSVKIRFIWIISIAFSLLTPSSDVYAQDADACKQCIQQKIDARWALRQQCLSSGKSQQDCSGQLTGPTCCHCWSGPQEDAFCWNVVCATECWMNQCADVCD